MRGLFRFSSCLLFLFWSLTGVAQAKTVVADVDNLQFYFLMDADTREVLLSKNADMQIAPSSMTKVMTAYVVFDQIKKGNIKFSNQCVVGKDAWRKSGSSIFLNYGDVVTIDQLLQGLLAVSGNDAAVTLAETTGNGIDNFIRLMNLKAKEIGLKNSHFKNPHGLYEEGHYMTLRDLATLTARMYHDFPQYRHYLNIHEFTYGKVTQQNHHPLIKAEYDGFLGGKTGHTNQGGYGAVAIIKRGARCLVAVVNKARTPKIRSQIMTNVVDYGFNNYKKLELFHKDQEIVNLSTWLGNSKKVAVATNQDIIMTVPHDKTLDDISVKVKYRGPVTAPIVKGAKVATLIIDVKGYKVMEYSLFAKETVDKDGFLGRIYQIISYKAVPYYRNLKKLL